MATSCTMASPLGVMAAATCRAVMRFSSPSVRTSPMGNWLPVMITGLCRFSSMKLSADAVNAIVSVPWSTTKPS